LEAIFELRAQPYS